MSAWFSTCIQSLLGIVVIVAGCWTISEDRRRFPLRLLGGTLAIELLLIVLFFGAPTSRVILSTVTAAVNALSSGSQAGTEFVFGHLAGGPTPYMMVNSSAAYIFGFRVLPVMLVICALSACLWHWGVLQLLTRASGVVFERLLGLTGPTALATAATIFLGQVEGPMLVRGYLAGLTRSELFTLMTVGFTCCSGAVMVGYASLLQGYFPNAAVHIVAASILAAPSGVLLAQIIMPRQLVLQSKPETVEIRLKYRSSIDAIMSGTTVGLQLVLSVGATLIVFVSSLHLLNSLLGACALFGPHPLTVQAALGVVFRPLAWLIGIPWSEAGAAGGLLAQKLALNAFLAFGDMLRLPAETLSDRSRILITYALAGFANLGSVGVMSAGLGVLIPERRDEILQMVWKALFGGFLGTCLTASLIGLLPPHLLGY